MGDGDVLITDRNYAEIAASWRDRLSRVDGGFRWGGGPEHASRTSSGPVTARLSPLALDTVRRIGVDALGEFAVAGAATALLLSRYTLSPTVVLRTPPLAEGDAGTTSEVPLIISIDEDSTVRDFLVAVAAVVEESYSAPEFPVEKFLRAEGAVDLARLSNVSMSDSRMHAATHGAEPVDVMIALRLERGEITIFAGPGQLDSFLVEGFARHLDILIGGLSRLDARLLDLEILGADDRHQLLVDFNRTETPGPGVPTVVSLFERQAARVPEAAALIYHGRATSYRSLDERSNRLAGRLRRDHAVGPEVIVAIMVDRSDLMVEAVLAVLKAGAAFVPIEPDYPPDRVRFILADTRPRLILTQSSSLAMLEGLDVRSILLDVGPTVEGGEPEDLESLAGPDNLAYVLYTSGSTGKPKGCQLEHRGLLNYIDWSNNNFFEDETRGNFGLYTSLCFDFTLTNLFCPLTRGKTLVISPQREGIQSILEHAFRPASGIDVMKLTPSHIRLLEHLDIKETGVRMVIVGGEELTPRHLRTLLEIDPAIEVYNEYGPTEATVGCTVQRVFDDGQTVPIGKPISNTRIYILDGFGRPCPIGVRGEVFVAGQGLARGYHNRPGMTAQRFVPDPFVDGGRLYRTGDFGRWLPSGSLEYFGRNDGQVKVRGFRIETGEVEAAIAAREGISDVVVMVREDRPGDRRLVAYVVAGPDLTTSILRSDLGEALPSYMIPSDIVLLPALPINRNGKVDRAALPAPSAVDGPDGDGQESPGTPLQMRLAAIWRDVLGVKRVGVSDDFFDLGGDSLLAIQVVSRVWGAFSVGVTIEDVFDAPTVEQLAARIEAASTGTRAPAGPASGSPVLGDELPLSFAQRRLWFLDRLEGPNSAYNVASLLKIDGLLDVPALGASLAEVIRRHDVLRTTFPDVGGKPSQRVAPTVPFKLTVVDLSDLPSSDREAEALRRARREAERPFDLGAGPLLRAILYHLDDGANQLAVVMHHIVSDAWSARILVAELGECYRALTRGERPGLPGIAVQYADFAARQRLRLESDAAPQLAYWKRHLEGAPRLIELPIDRARPPVKTYAGGSVAIRVDRPVARDLRSLSQQSGASLFMTLLAAFATLLSRLGGQGDLVVGSPVANRNQPEFEPLIGFFVNTLALRIDLSGRPTFRQLLERVRKVVLDGVSNQDVPFERLVDALEPVRTMSHSPIFQVAFAFENLKDSLPGLPGLTITPVESEATTSKFDLTLQLEDSATGLAGAFEYSRDLFEESTIRRMVGHFQTLLAAIAEAPDRCIMTLPLLTPDERQRLLTIGHDEVEAFPTECIHRLFEAQASRAPGRVAVSFDGRSLSYRALNRRANRLARTLAEHGVGPEVLVGICAERSPDLIVGALAILKAGGAYVPIDPAYPESRIQFLLEDSGVRVLLSQKGLSGRLPESRALVLWLDEDLAESQDDDANADHGVGPENLAYVIYTSGSTGRPKGVGVTHSNVARLFGATRHWFEFGPEDVWTLFHSFAFDFSVWETWGALLHGGRLVIVDYWDSRSPDEFLELLSREQVTVLNQTPSAFRQLIWAEGRRPSSRQLALRLVIFGGEALEVRWLSPWFDRHGDRVPRLINMYGITETTVHVTYRPLTIADLDAHPGRSPIGRAIPDLRIYLLDGEMEPVPVGVPGEIHVGGAGVARGYLNRPGLTAERFVPDRFEGTDAGTLYRSGDLGRWTPDGQIEYLGRADRQVKVRGHRIELGEVEAALAADPALSSAIVQPRADGGGELSLVAYVVPASGHPRPDPRALRASLKGTLPDHMIPSAIVPIDALPLTPHGKVDRDALPPRPSSRVRLDRDDAPMTPGEAILTRAWREVLGIERVDRHDNFFELGGDSILIIQVVARAAGEGIEITPRQVFQNQTIAELAGVARSAAEARIAHVEATGPSPLTPIQSWFFEHYPEGPPHYNQSVLLEVSTSISPDLLAEALDFVHVHHDGLRLRLREDSQGWTQEVAPTAEGPGFAVEDLHGLNAEDRQAAMEAVAARLESAIDLGHGPLVHARLFLFGPDQPARLLIICHHLAVDGVSWRILLEDLAVAVEQRTAGQPIRLAAKTTPLREWASLLSRVARSEPILSEASSWLDSSRDGAEPLPVDRPGGRASNTVALARGVSVELDEDQTRALLRDVPHAYNTRINDALLTALAFAFRGWTDDGRLLVDLEGHGREDLPAGLAEGVDLSRTVGWFTTIAPLLLDLPADVTTGEAIKTIKEQARRAPGGGLGYMMLRYLGPEDQLRSRLRSMRRPEVAFNYLGQVDGVMPPGSGFRPAMEAVGSQRGAGLPRAHLLEVNAVVSDGRLRIDWIYGEAVHDRATVERLAGAFLDALRRLIDHCRLPTSRGFTSSDFPEARLSQRELDSLARRIDPDAIADVYDLSPMQQGLLFHHLFDPGAPAYFEQLAWTIEGELDVAAFRRAWQRALDEHPSLRAAFAWRDLGHPVQVVIRDAEPAWDVLDWSTSSPERRGEAFAAWLKRDRERGFDLTRAPLTRFLLARWGDGSHRFCWSHHHILLDGWSVANVLKGVFADYDSAVLGGLRRGEPPARPFRDYIAWLRAQDHAGSEAFWRAELAGFTTPTPLPTDQIGVEGESARVATQEIRLSERLTARLRDAVRNERLTLNSLFRGAWAIVLGRLGGNPDVCFGTTTAGRPPSLAGVESMVGLFINTLPTRIRVDDARGLAEWLREIQAKQADAEPFAFSSLVDIQRWSEVPGGTPLFHSILVFENYPVDRSLEGQPGGLRVSEGRAFEQTNYPLGLEIVPEARTLVRLRYDPARLRPATVRRLLDQILALLEAFEADPDRKLGELAMSTPAGPPPSSSSHQEIPSNGKGDPSHARRASRPATANESRLARIWREVLAVPNVGPADNFFDLGGHSILAIRLMARVEQEFGTHLSLARLFREPTLERMAVAVAGRGGPRDEWDPLVEIRPGGDRAALFLMPGAGGNVLYFRPLAGRLSPGRAIYGLQAIGLDGTTPPLTRVEEIAARNLESVLRVAPAGPYLLAGHSFGGRVAFEMSQQLRRRGLEVGLLAILDTPAPVANADPAWANRDDAEWLDRDRGQIGAFLGVDLEIEYEQLAGLDRDAQLDHVIARIAARGGRLLAGADADQLRAFVAVYKANFEARYLPAADVHPVPIVLFRASDSNPLDRPPTVEVAALKREPTWGWGRFAEGPVEVEDLPGDHLGMLLEPHAAALGERLERLLDRPSPGRKGGRR